MKFFKVSPLVTLLKTSFFRYYIVKTLDSDSNRATAPIYEQNSCIVAVKHDLSCGFANVWVGTIIVIFDF